MRKRGRFVDTADLSKYDLSDADWMRASGVHAFLVGEVFMRAPKPGVELERIFITH